MTILIVTMARPSEFYGRGPGDVSGTRGDGSTGAGLRAGPPGMSAEAPENQRCLLTPVFQLRFFESALSTWFIARFRARAVTANIAADIPRLYFGRLCYRPIVPHMEHQANLNGSTGGFRNVRQRTKRIAKAVVRRICR